MAGNIYGYQGVHTPLESVTQGRYTLADYTTMRTELTSRLIALENQGGFIPTNVEITGYLHMLPGGAGLGEIETTSSITGASLYINGEMHGGNVVCDNDLACGGILSGNGSGLTNITGTDSTKLPLAGGTLTGPLISQAITVNAGYTISGNGSGLTNINDITKLPLSGGTLTNSLTITAPGKFIGDGSLLTGVAASDPTKVPLAGGTMTGSLTLTAPAKFIGDGSLLTGVTSTDVTKLPLAGGTMTGAIAMGANAITSTGSISAATFSGNGAALTGVTSTDATKLPLAGGTLTGALAMGSNAITSTGSISAATFSGNGAALTSVTGTDASKLPLAGGTMSGLINAFDVKFIPGYSGVNYKLNYYQNIANTIATTYIPVSSNRSYHDSIRLTANSTCSVNLQNMVANDVNFYQDRMRLVTITKVAMAAGDYVVTVFPPNSYLFCIPTINGVITDTMPIGTFSVTYMINGIEGRIDLVNRVV